ncbi:hypothetical protein CMUS01_08147 [Colletotrichum musicola]|uniref:DUF6536 domain-containing protein n=1 Tax=Colletotrichum musicola TaxID=2175873 RepID=A0A8H6NDF4_9PEZI|nr:hypothetical protein CMUS01_08147 [Colletotrichum musicola]
MSLIPSSLRKSRLARSLHSLPDGWRRMAFVNVALLSTVLLALIGILAAAVSETGGDLRQSWKFHESDCQTGQAKVTNTLLHLLINILSTIVLVSSNFFMQVLNAPSPQEVDAAHTSGTWLDIGIPSWRNAFHLSRFKLALWLSLALTSVPIHVLFNGSVFLMDSRMDDFHMTVASESFLEGGHYFLPGASLHTRETYIDGLGDQASLPTFKDLAGPSFEDSVYAINVSETAARASEWKRLEVEECLQIYGFCVGLQAYRNVVVVAEGPSWTRSEVWNVTPAADELWEPIVPRDQPNTLWSSVQCTMSGFTNASRAGCRSSCRHVTNLGLLPVIRHWNWDNDLQDAHSQGGWDSILYCRAELRHQTCAVALSKPLLFAVILSVLLKVVICVVVLRALGSREPLVTLGDAVSYFISNQKDDELASGLLTQRILRTRGLKTTTSADGKTKSTILEPLGPRQWVIERHGKIGNHHRRACAVPRTVWVTTHIIFFLGLAGAAGCFIMQIRDGMRLHLLPVFDAIEAANRLQPIGKSLTFIYSTLVVNAPHLFLSLWYLALNACITRLEMVREWALFSEKFCPLRVTQPKGQQVATYRLQLRYKYSISLIIFSVASHWLVSNALSILVSEGTYYQSSDVYQSDPISLPQGAVVMICTAALPLLILISLFSMQLVLLWSLSTEPLRSPTLVVGSNSLAIAAACRVSPLAKIPTDLGDRKDEQDAELDELMPRSIADSGAEESLESGGSKNMAHYRLKWGEVEMPEEWYGRPEHDQAPERIGHLSFGTVLDDPQPPVEGRWYN